MDAMNSEIHKDHRLQLADNKWPDRCINCKEAEQSRLWPDEDGHLKGSSRYNRTIEMAKEIPEIIRLEQADTLTDQDGSVTQYPVELDIQFGNLCNSKCIMCSPQFSNMWYDDWAVVNGTKSKFYELVPDNRGRLTSTMPNWWEHENFWKQLDEVAPRLRLLYFLGGEPLIVPALEEMLDILIERGYAKNIIVEFHTNGTVYNQRLTEKMLKFKRVKFQLSLDDTEDRYHLVRFPGDFATFKKNAKKYQDNGLFFEAFNGCIGLSTIYSPMRTIPFAKQFNTRFHFRFLYTPAEQSLKILPKSAKLEIIKNYVQHADVVGETGIAVCRFLRDNLEYEDPALVKKYVQFMDKLDTLRGTNWRTTLDDVYDLLTRHCPRAFDQ
jgi:organic radical activating enzyme